MVILLVAAVVLDRLLWSSSDGNLPTSKSSPFWWLAGHVTASSCSSCFGVALGVRASFLLGVPRRGKPTTMVSTVVATMMNGDDGVMMCHTVMM